MLRCNNKYVKKENTWKLKQCTIKINIDNHLTGIDRGESGPTVKRNKSSNHEWSSGAQTLHYFKAPDQCFISKICQPVTLIWQAMCIINLIVSSFVEDETQLGSRIQHFKIYSINYAEHVSE